MNGPPEGRVATHAWTEAHAVPKRRAARAALEGDELGNTAYIDLSKVQMFFCTLVAAVSYAVLRFSVIVTTKYPWDITAFPSLPGGLVAIRFISHAGYMTNKAVDQTKTRLS